MRFCHGAMKSVTRANEMLISDLKADFAPQSAQALVKQKTAPPQLRLYGGVFIIWFRLHGKAAARRLPLKLCYETFFTSVSSCSELRNLIV